MRCLNVWKIVALVASIGQISLFAESTELERAFKGGTWDNHVGIYAEQRKYNNTQPRRVGFSSGSASLGFETAPMYGIFVWGMQAWGTTKITQQGRGYNEAIRSNSIFPKAFLRAEDVAAGSLTIGRQKVDFDWLTYYVEGVVASLKSDQKFVLDAAYVKRRAVVDFDEVSEVFTRTNANKDFYFLQANYNYLDALTLRPYVYYAPDIFTAPGVRADMIFRGEEASLALKASITRVEASGALADSRDGGVMTLEQTLSIPVASLALGYIQTDDKGGVGRARSSQSLLTTYGDKNPLEEGTHIYGIDARTLYFKMGLDDKSSGMRFGAALAKTKYAALFVDILAQSRETEFDFWVGYTLLKNLDTDFIYARVGSDNRDESYNAFKGRLKYTF